jgi:hypothetical protein
MCSLAYEFLSFGTFHTSGEERLVYFIFVPNTLALSFPNAFIGVDFGNDSQEKWDSYLESIHKVAWK